MRLRNIALLSCLLTLAVAATLAAQSEPTQLALLSGSTEAEITAQAEKDGAAFATESRPPTLIPKAFLKPDIKGSVDRKCVATTGLTSARSGQFVIGGELSERLMTTTTTKKLPPKIWWVPLHHTPVMTLVVRGKLVGSSGAGARFTSSTVAWPTPREGEVPVAEREYFFPSGIEFLLEAGRWIVVATQGPDWGCFVLNMPPAVGGVR